MIRAVVSPASGAVLSRGWCVYVTSALLLSVFFLGALFHEMNCSRPPRIRTIVEAVMSDPPGPSVEELVVSSEARFTSVCTTPRRKQTGLFVRGPIPVRWLRLLHELCSRSSSAWVVAIAVWHKVGLERGKTERLRLSTSFCSRFGVDRFTKRRGLAALEQAGLVSVDRQPGKATVVTLLLLEEE